MAASVADRRAFAVVAPSGSGKSTAAGFLREGFEANGLRVAVVKLAEPLYQLQREFYRRAGREIDAYAQDQPLLEAIAAHLRALSPRALVDDFLRRLDASGADVVINDDLRDPHVDWPALREAGFRVVGILADERFRRERLARRHDLAIATDAPASRELDLIPVDIELENNGSLGELESAIGAMVRRELG
jgi:dephospho-CoA kinase